MFSFIVINESLIIAKIEINKITYAISFFRWIFLQR